MANELYSRLKLIKEHLIALTSLCKGSTENDGFKKCLAQGLAIENMNFETFSKILYFLLGILDCQERDKLIRWPLINIDTTTKFKKGILSMANQLKNKYPWANIRTLSNSYYSNPCSNLPKVADFILRMSSLAIYILLNDPSVLIMTDIKEFKEEEKEIAMGNIQKACLLEEEKITNNMFNKQDFEKAKEKIMGKCVALKKEIDFLESEKEKTKKELIKFEQFDNGKDVIQALKKLKDQSLSDLEKINEDLHMHHTASMEALSAIRTVENPVTLHAGDVACSSDVDLMQSTEDACQRLSSLLDSLNADKTSVKEKEMCCQQLKLVKLSLIKEKDVLRSQLSKNEM